MRVYAWGTNHFSSLVLGVYDDGKLRYAGCVGTGFDDKSLAYVYSRLKPLETTKNPFGKRIDVTRKVTWVEPRLVCEVKFTEWTKDGRLRAPVFLGLRDDKPAVEAVRESAPRGTAGFQRAVRRLRPRSTGRL